MVWVKLRCAGCLLSHLPKTKDSCAIFDSAFINVGNFFDSSVGGTFF